MRKTPVLFIAAASGALILAGVASAQIRGGAMGGLGGSMTPGGMPGQGLPTSTIPGDVTANGTARTTDDASAPDHKTKKPSKDAKARAAGQAGADTSATTGEDATPDVKGRADTAAGAQTPGMTGSAGASGQATTNGADTSIQGGANAGATGGPH